MENGANGVKTKTHQRTEMFIVTSHFGFNVLFILEEFL
jgi:hypothetical protein